MSHDETRGPLGAACIRMQSITPGIGHTCSPYVYRKSWRGMDRVEQSRAPWQGRGQRRRQRRQREPGCADARVGHAVVHVDGALRLPIEAGREDDVGDDAEALLLQLRRENRLRRAERLVSTSSPSQRSRAGTVNPSTGAQRLAVGPPQGQNGLSALVGLPRMVQPRAWCLPPRPRASPLPRGPWSCHAR